MTTFRIEAAQIEFTSQHAGVAALCTAMAARMAPPGIAVGYRADERVVDAVLHMTLRQAVAEIDVALPPPTDAPDGAHRVEVILYEGEGEHVVSDAHHVVIDARRAGPADEGDVEAWRNQRELLRTALGAFFLRRDDDDDDLPLGASVNTAGDPR